MMHIKVEGIAVNIVLADKPRFIGFVDGALQRSAFSDEFAAYIDVTGMRAHGEGGHKRAFDQRMRVVAHDLAVLAGARLRLVGVYDQVMRPRRIDFLGHERPFHAGREARASATAQTGLLHLCDQRVSPAIEQRLGVVPLTALFRARQRGIAEAI